ncbi:MAG: aminotransferase class I/II-fold pyridoxal phosphate-dependent enzyme [Candidatus Zixiibacteriota bacterium]
MRPLREATICAMGAKDQPHGVVTPPIYQTSTFRFNSTEEVAAYARGESDKFLYTRYGNPTWEHPESTLATLEHGARAFLFASGSAATAAWCHAHLRPGDRLVAASQLYGGTAYFLQQYLKPAGIIIQQVNFADLSQVEAALRGARACWFETPTNPTVRVVDGPAVAALCRRHGVLSAVDNTFATPINQKPLDCGIDWVMHSTTKYLNGHNDLIGGVLIASKDVDPEPVAAARRGIGGIMDPHAAFLLDRGLKTLALRVERHNSNALSLALYLGTKTGVAHVHYPGLPEDPGHAVAKRQMRGFGGVLAIDLAGGYEAVARFADRLRIINNAASLGGVESLISLPILTSHVHASEDERREAGVTDGTARISVGIEDIDDLKADVDQALSAI